MPSIFKNIFRKILIGQLPPTAKIISCSCTFISLLFFWHFFFCSFYPLFNFTLHIISSLSSFSICFVIVRREGEGSTQFIGDFFFFFFDKMCSSVHNRITQTEPIIWLTLNKRICHFGVKFYTLNLNPIIIRKSS